MTVSERPADTRGKPQTRAKRIDPRDFAPLLVEFRKWAEGKVKGELDKLQKEELRVRQKYAHDQEKLNLELYPILENRKMLEGGTHGKLLRAADQLMQFLQAAEPVADHKAEGAAQKAELAKREEDLMRQAARLATAENRIKAEREELERQPSAEDIQKRVLKLDDRETSLAEQRRDLEELESHIDQKEKACLEESERVERERTDLERSVQQLADKELLLEEKKEELEQDRQLLEKEKEDYMRSMKAVFVAYIQDRAKTLAIDALEVAGLLSDEELKDLGIAGKKRRKRAPRGRRSEKPADPPAAESARPPEKPPEPPPKAEAAPPKTEAPPPRDEIYPPKAQATRPRDPAEETMIIPSENPPDLLD